MDLRFVGNTRSLLHSNFLTQLPKMVLPSDLSWLTSHHILSFYSRFRPNFVPFLGVAEQKSVLDSSSESGSMGCCGSYSRRFISSDAFYSWPLVHRQQSFVQLYR